MRCIIIGLGNFGSSLALKLTNLGNEVIAVDKEMTKINRIKDKVTHAICLDSTDLNAVNSLPINMTDVAIVCIGKDTGANIMTTATLKNLNVKRLISRSINSLHENVLQAIGINEIIRPEEETASRWSNKINYKNVIESFELSKNFSIVEVVVPEFLVGKTIEELSFRNNFNLLILTIIKNRTERSLIGKYKTTSEAQGIPSPQTMLEKDDVIVTYGANSDIKKFIKSI